MIFSRRVPSCRARPHAGAGTQVGRSARRVPPPVSCYRPGRVTKTPLSRLRSVNYACASRDNTRHSAPRRAAVSPPGTPHSARPDNCYSNYAQTNAQDLMDLLTDIDVDVEQPHAPVEQPQES